MLSDKKILNLLSNNQYGDLLEAAIEAAQKFDLLSWKVRQITSKEANWPYDDIFSDDARGVSLVGEVIIAPVPENYDYIFYHDNPQLNAYLLSVKDILKDKDPSFSSTHFMDDKGFIDWHTNTGESPLKPYRLYVTYNQSVGSFFKYIDNDSKTVITINEPIGWYAKLFNTDDRVLHCVKSGGNRYSIGIRF